MDPKVMADLFQSLDHNSRVETIQAMGCGEMLAGAVPFMDCDTWIGVFKKMKVKDIVEFLESLMHYQEFHKT